MSLVKVGDLFETSFCGGCKVVGYESSQDVLVEFVDTGYRCFTSSAYLRSGTVKDPYAKRVAGVGFLGEGNAVTVRGKLGTHNPYSTWSSMIKRCYDRSSKDFQRYGGRGITVIWGWHNYQNFALWHKINYKEGMYLDKDLLKPFSKIYSPVTCEYIPKDINSILTSSVSARGDYPVGVHKRGNLFIMQCCTDHGRTQSSGYSTQWLAFAEYKRIKLDHIKVVADRYLSLGQISEGVYNTLINWEVIPYPE